jgi:hypothetical protein
MNFVNDSSYSHQPHQPRPEGKVWRRVTLFGGALTVVSGILLAFSVVLHAKYGQASAEGSQETVSYHVEIPYDCPHMGVEITAFAIKDSEGNIHSDVEPALVIPRQCVAWYYRGEFHREGGPAFTGIPGGPYEGVEEWYYKGQLHNTEGPAQVTPEFIAYWVNGKLHNPDGPALVWKDGHKEWWVAGERHNEIGPAVIHSDGHTEYWEYGEFRY